MKPGSVIKLKGDRRYKLGNVKKVNGVLRGHPETIKLTRPYYEGYYNNLYYNLNPPIVISRELAKAIEETEK